MTTKVVLYDTTDISLPNVIEKKGFLCWHDSGKEHYGMQKTNRVQKQKVEISTDDHTEGVIQRDDSSAPGTKMKHCSAKGKLQEIHLKLPVNSGRDNYKMRDTAATPCES